MKNENFAAVRETRLYAAIVRPSPPLSLQMLQEQNSEFSGRNGQILGWCLEAARENKLREEDYWGGFVIDEMKILVNGYLF